MEISIIICTYNRSDILSYCLDAICDQTIGCERYEVVVVDNNSNDDTHQVVLGYQKTNSNIKYFFEKEQGLSCARNRGAIEARADWLLYLDDDGKAPQDFVAKAISLSKENEFDCFGGTYNAWHLTTPPKWLPSQFGTCRRLADTKTVLDEKNLSGGIFAIKKSVLADLNFFRRDFGMSGNQIGYGEESELQDRLRHNGYIIGYDPSFYMDHLVGQHKYALSWHIKNRYARGRDTKRMWNSRSKQRYRIVRHSMNKGYRILKSALAGIYRLYSDEKYYKENYILDTLGEANYIRGLYS